MYPRINKSKQGYFWKVIGATNETGEITFNSLMSALFSYDKDIKGNEFLKANLKHFESVDALKKFLYGRKQVNPAIKDPKKYAISYYMQDFDMILNDLVILSQKYLNGREELLSLARLNNTKELTAKEFITFVENSSKKDDIVLSAYVIKLKEDNPERILDDSYKNELLIRYFNNAKTIRDFKNPKKANVNKLLEGLFDQFIIERIALNNMSKLIQEPISVSKHAGQDSNANARYIKYQKKVDKATIEKSKRFVMLGTNDTDYLYGFAISLDRDINERIENKLKKKTNSEVNKDYFKENPNKKAKVLNTYTSRSEAKRDMESFIAERAKILLLGNMYMDTSRVQTLYKNIIELNKLLENRRNLNANKDAIEKIINYFEYNGIPFYLLRRFIDDTKSVKQHVTDSYVGDGVLSFKGEKDLVNNIDNLYSFMIELEDTDYRETFSVMYSNNKTISEYFLNINRLEEGMYVLDSENRPMLLNAEEDPDEDLINEAISRDFIQNQFSFNNTDNADVIQKSNSDLKEEAITTIKKELTNKLNFTIRNEIKKYKDILNSLKTEIEILIKNDENVSKELLDNKNKAKNLNIKTRSQIIINDKKVRNVLRNEQTRKQLKKITSLNNIRKSNENKINEINKKIKVLQARLNEKEKLITDLESAVRYQKNSKDLVEKLSEENAKDTLLLEERKALILQRALMEHLGGGISLLRSDENSNGVGGSGIGDATIKKPKMLKQEDLDNFKAKSILTMQSKIRNILGMVNTLNEDTIKQSIKYLYKFIKEEQKDFRLVLMTPPDEDEGRYKTIINYIRKYDPKIDDELFGEPKIDKGFLPETLDLINIKNNNRYNALRFNNLDELIEWQKGPNNKVVMNGKVYNRIDPKIVLKNNENLTPTLKEIRVTSEEQLLELYNQVKNTRNILGFVDLNDWMETMNSVYTPYKFDTQFDKFLFNAQIMSKNISKFSAPFLARNLYDTVNQLLTNNIILPKSINAETFMNSTINSIELYSLYTKYSDEHTISIINMGIQYEDILKEMSKPVVNETVINKKLNLMTDMLKSYIKIGSTLNNERITYRIKEAKRILNNLVNLDIKFIKDNQPLLKQVVTFISNINFGEFIELYDNRIIDNVWVAGLRTDNKNADGQIITTYTSLDKKIKNYALKKPLLKQLSAFMNTEALNDYLKKDRFEMLPEFFENYRGYNEKDFSVDTYENIKKRLGKQKGGMLRFLDPRYMYEKINTVIENGARITNFFYNIMMYNKTFDEAVSDSLTHWFNYGMRSPLEFRLLTDMPFISFPVRSIENWIDRINSTKYWRFMADFLGGWYGQYRDEETKEFDDFIKYQMRQGWVPFGTNFGIRIGNGAFDTLNILYNTQQELDQRASPMLRGIKAIAEGKGAFEAIKQSAFIGLLGRVVNTTTGIFDMYANTPLRENVSKTPVANQLFETRPATIGTTYRGFAYDINNYDRYTPRQYRYGRNGRYAKYENIYKDWFNKYGRMRKPKLNPYYLVKDIQWRQYVRMRRSKVALNK